MSSRLQLDVIAKQCAHRAMPMLFFSDRIPGDRTAFREVKIAKIGCIRYDNGTIAPAKLRLKSNPLGFTEVNIVSIPEHSQWIFPSIPRIFSIPYPQLLSIPEVNILEFD